MIYTLCPEKKRPQYSRHNFDKFRQLRNFWQEYSVLNITKFSPTLQHPYM